MKECYVCGISEEKAILYEGISKFGFSSICRKCYFKNKIPLVEKKEIDLNEVTRRRTVKERLVSMAGLEKKEEKIKNKSGMIEQDKFPEEELRQLVESNSRKKIEESVNAEDVLDNFNWIIMRKRRLMKLTRSEFAEKIFESPILIEALESGKVPKDYPLLFRKIENFLDVRLLKSSERFHPELLAHESRISSGLKVEDLKNLNKIRNKRDLDKFDNIVKEHMEGRSVSSVGTSKGEISERDLDDIIFGRK